MNYYNEIDKGAAAWIRELIKAGLIPPGIVDERSIVEVRKEDLAGFTQCHFFCGISGWPLALSLAGIPATVPLWTGSPPCQPFSVAGKQLGKDDPRHLAPAFLELIAQCRPERLYGEQVAAAISKHWLDALLIELEEQGYVCGAAVLPACSVGAPHKRDRLFFGAHRLAYAGSFGNNERYDNSALQGRQDKTEQSGVGSSACSMAHGDHDRQRSGSRGRCGGEPSRERHDTGRYGEGCSVADTDDARPQRRSGMPECADQQSVGASGMAGELADTVCEQFNGCRPSGQGRRTQSANSGVADAADTHHGFWSDADWLGCRDGKFRPVEARNESLVNGLSGSLGCSSDPSFRKAFEEIGFPLGKEIPARVARLRGYGNAIVPQCAAEFIKAFNGAIADQKEKAATKN